MGKIECGYVFLLFVKYFKRLTNMASELYWILFQITVVIYIHGFKNPFKMRHLILTITFGLIQKVMMKMADLFHLPIG